MNTGNTYPFGIPGELFAELYQLGKELPAQRGPSALKLPFQQFLLYEKPAPGNEMFALNAESVSGGSCPSFKLPLKYCGYHEDLNNRCLLNRLS